VAGAVVGGPTDVGLDHERLRAGLRSGHRGAVRGRLGTRARGRQRRLAGGPGGGLGARRAVLLRSRSGRLGRLERLLAGRRGRGHGEGHRLAALGEPLGVGIHPLEHLAHRAAVEIAEHVDAELVQQRPELQSRLLGDETLEPRRAAGVVVLLRDDAGEEQPLHRAQIEGDEVPPQRRGADERHHERRDAVDPLERLDAVGDGVLLGVVEREAVGRLEHPLEHAPQRQGGAGRIGQVVEHLRELGDRRHPHLVQVEIGLAEPAERLRRQVVGGVLQAAGVEHLLEEGALGIHLDRFVGRAQRLVELGDELLAIGLLAVLRAHASSWETSPSERSAEAGGGTAPGCGDPSAPEAGRTSWSTRASSIDFFTPWSISKRRRGV